MIKIVSVRRLYYRVVRGQVYLISLCGSVRNCKESIYSGCRRSVQSEDSTQSLGARISRDIRPVDEIPTYTYIQTPPNYLSTYKH
jgi:hypothetical protein